MPAKQSTRCLAPATPVFAGMPAPTGPAQAAHAQSSCTAGFGGSWRNPGNGWSFGGPGTGIGGNKGAPGWLS
ncbi:Uncharacterized protein KF715C_ch45030 [Pseudomonas putida]|uniref:Uncharacterized protein n=1 Tax=Pseudomonas putida TaxID=303 RepID=A0A1L7NHU8_PSEPU|nr:Uncharacterized protein KF715C_ch45030 [Pseudomonas putida]